MKQGKEFMNIPPLQYKMYAAQDRGAREDQQDSVNSSLPELQADLGVLCVLSDGMGGLADGARASRAVTAVSTWLTERILPTFRA